MRHLLLGSTAERLLRQDPAADAGGEADPDRQLPPHAGAGGFLALVTRSAGACAAPSRRAPRSCCFTPSTCLSRGGCGWPAWRRTRSINTASRRGTTPRGDLRQLGAEVGLDPFGIQYCVLQGDASRRIIEQEQEQDCDLIVLGKHGRNIVEETAAGQRHQACDRRVELRRAHSAQPSAA
ncbi:MAG: universal stress protein [Comamonadaceae bacterium]|nr:universal stress protein [Comamonadaceae bacterium]